MNGNRIEELEALVKRYQKSYYMGEGEISDAEFDALWDELRALDPDNPVFSAVGSDRAEDYESAADSSADSSPDSGNFAKAKHRIPMGSQEKAANPEQFFAWALKHPYKEYLVEYKLDGASLELQYDQGKLVRAVTRGDGETGDDITRNALKMQGVVKDLGAPYTGGVRGEVIMSHEVHRKHFSDKANCRNAANGLMKRKDGEKSEFLKVICYDAFFTDLGGAAAPFSDEEEKMLWLEKTGFAVSPLKICDSADAVVDYRSEVMEKRGSLDYDIDGLVIKNRTIDMDDAARARPDKQIAFKFSLEEAVSVLRNVVWNENGATYTPVAEFDTVELAGTKVSRASLSNPNTIRDLELVIGSHVVVTKRGEIIPKIERIVKVDGKPVREEMPPAPGQLFADPEGCAVPMPETCSVCGAKLVNEGTRLYCPNKSCSKRVLHRLEKWVGTIDIRDLGTTLIHDLFEAGAVKSIYDLYGLTESVLAGFFLNEESLEKDKVSLGARKVCVSIENSRNVTLGQFIAGFDIEGIGETMVDKLIEAGFDSLKKLLDATEEAIAGVFGFAEITARTLVQGLEENRAEMEKLVGEGIITIKKADMSGGKLFGLSFCFTGELLTMKRSQAEAMVKSLGGSAKSSVVKGLSYLVTNDTASGSSKNQKAAKLGIPVIDEKAFIALCNE